MFGKLGVITGFEFVWVRIWSSRDLVTGEDVGGGYTMKLDRIRGEQSWRDWGCTFRRVDDDGIVKKDDTSISGFIMCNYPGMPSLFAFRLFFAEPLDGPSFVFTDLFSIVGLVDIASEEIFVGTIGDTAFPSGIRCRRTQYPLEVASLRFFIASNIILPFPHRLLGQIRHVLIVMSP